MSSQFNYNENVSEAAAAWTNLHVSGNVTSGNAQLNALQYNYETVTAVTSAASTTIPLTLVDSTLGAMALSLADGTAIGQQKQFIYTVVGGDVTLTPATTNGSYNTITFTNGGGLEGQCVTLAWTAVGWSIISRAGAPSTLATNAVANYPVIT